jgi:1-acyl-sn-glycerol-3-phosphate acyltransferase
MRWIENFRLAYRMCVFLVSTVLMWTAMELELLVLRRPKRATINRWVPRWARFNLKVFGVQLEAHGPQRGTGQVYPGSEPGGVGRIFVANHRSGMDIPVLFTVAETRVISRHDLATWPLLGRAAQRVGTLFVDRNSRRSGAAVLRAVDATLQRGEGVAMFPEGTAHEGDQVHEFLPGAFNAARRAGAQIVPIGLAYSHPSAYYSGLTFLAHMTRIARLPRMQVAVEMGTPLTVGERPVVEVIRETQQQVQTLVDRARGRLDALQNG